MTKIQLKRSSILNSSTVSRAPTASQLDYGELAINYNSADPQFFIKDSSGSVIRVLDAYAKVDGTTFTGDVNFDGNVKIKGDSTNGAGKLTLSCETDTYSVNIKAPPTSAAASYTLTLPTSAGSNSQVLTTDGSGGLSWAVSSMSTADKNKLDGIESGATADQTGAEIKSLYEAEADTNAFTDALLNKLNNIASGAQVNVATNLGKSTATTSITITSSTGTDVTIGEATGSIAGLMSTSHHNKLDGIESGATADQSASEILTAIKTVDGSGSGLDADLLDGIQASGFLRSDADDSFTGTITGNSDGTNPVLNIDGAGPNIIRFVDDGSTTKAIDLVFRTNPNTLGFEKSQYGTKLWETDCDDGVTNFHYTPTVSGSTIWHAGNDGSGSGLDADLLDGIQASSFLRSDADDQTTGQLTADTLLLTNDATDTARHRVAVYGSGTSSTSYGMMLWNSNGTSGDWATMIYGPNQSNRRISFGKINDSTFTNHADVTQIAHFDLDDSTLRLTADAYVNNSKVWHAGNDGSGSGLDADLLDGIQGSSYLRSDTSDTFSGGTLTVNGGSGLAIKAESADFAEQLEIHRNHASNSPAIKFSNDSGQVGILYADPTGNVLRWRDGTSTNNYEIWHAGNDGSGSGLDADTLDGLTSTQFVQNSSGLESNLDTYYVADMFGWSTSTTGRPESYGQGIAIVSSGRTHNNSNNWITQLAFGTSTTGSYFRTKVNSGGWSGWHKLWNSGNDGSGSGLDADTLDGVQGSNYLRSDVEDQATVINIAGELSANSSAKLQVYGFSRMGPIMLATGTASTTSFTTTNERWILNNGSHLYASTASNSYNNKIWTDGNDGSGSGLDADLLDGIQASSFLRSDANDVIGGVLSYHSDTARLQFRNTSYNTYLYIGGWTTTNSNDISRIRNSSGNLHIDSAANGHLYLNHYSTGTIYARGSTVWHAGNDGAGSGLDADNLDGKTWTSSGKNLRGTEIYADNWFRNYNNGEGLYNEANVMYWYSDSNTRWRLRSNQSTAQIIFATSGNSVRGYVHASSSNDIGFLDSDGNWTVRCVRDSYVELRDNDQVSFRAGQGGVDGNYGTVSTHGGGKGNWEGYSINGRYVWMHDGGNAAGLYNDVDNEWHVYMVRNSYVRLYHNGSTCFETTGSSSANIGGSKVWHAGNDGSGSGLDADTLDGINSEFFLRSDISDQYSGTINGSGSFAVSRESSYTPGAGNTNQGIVLRSTRVAYFSYNGVGAYFNRNSDGDLISYRRSGTEEGSVEINTSRVYFRTTSDYRRKINVTPIANGVDVIKALNPSSYNWIEDNRLDHGFLAHEIQEHIPGSASGYKDEVDEEGEPVYQKVDLTTVVPFLTAALKDSIARIESLEATVAALESQYAS